MGLPGKKRKRTEGEEYGGSKENPLSLPGKKSPLFFVSKEGKKKLLTGQKGY